MMTPAAITRHIRSLSRPLILDGGLATQLEASGHRLDDHLWSGSLLLRNPGAIVSAHTAFIEAGAECVISASYQASRGGFEALGLDHKAADAMIASSVDLARQAIDQTSNERCLVAASVGPYGATLHDGSEYTGNYSASPSALRTFHAERLEVLAAAGADFLACETIPCLREAEVLARLLDEMAVPAWVSFCCRDEDSLSDGTPVAEAAELFAGSPFVFAVGINCTAPAHASKLLRHLRRATADQLLIAYPNSGERYSEGQWHEPTPSGMDPEAFAKHAAAWSIQGALLVGGCCRVGPDHIRAIARTFR